jgi:hypothetical protein
MDLFQTMNYSLDILASGPDSTWGGEFAPMEGESIYVPTGLNLLVDIDSTP